MDNSNTELNLTYQLWDERSFSRPIQNKDVPINHKPFDVDLGIITSLNIVKKGDSVGTAYTQNKEHFSGFMVIEKDIDSMYTRTMFIDTTMVAYVLAVDRVTEQDCKTYANKFGYEEYKLFLDSSFAEFKVILEGIYGEGCIVHTKYRQVVSKNMLVIQLLPDNTSKTARFVNLELVEETTDDDIGTNLFLIFANYPDMVDIETVVVANIEDVIYKIETLRTEAQNEKKNRKKT